MGSGTTGTSPEPRRGNRLKDDRWLRGLAARPGQLQLKISPALSGSAGNGPGPVRMLGLAVLGAASHQPGPGPAGRLLFGAYLGAIMAHFVIARVGGGCATRFRG